MELFTQICFGIALLGGLTYVTLSLTKYELDKLNYAQRVEKLRDKNSIDINPFAAWWQGLISKARGLLQYDLNVEKVFNLQAIEIETDTAITELNRKIRPEHHQKEADNKKASLELDEALIEECKIKKVSPQQLQEANAYEMKTLTESKAYKNKILAEAQVYEQKLIADVSAHIAKIEGEIVLIKQHGINATSLESWHRINEHQQIKKFDTDQQIYLEQMKTTNEFQDKLNVIEATVIKNKHELHKERYLLQQELDGVLLEIDDIESSKKSDELKKAMIEQREETANALKALLKIKNKLIEKGGEDED